MKITTLAILFVAVSSILYNSLMLTGHVENSNVTRYSNNMFYRELRIIPNNTYYVRSVNILNSGSPYYWESMVYSYKVSNIDNDEYPDIVLWTLKHVMIWSYNRGIYKSIKAQYYFDNPILIDYDKDSVTDYIILFDHPGYDAGIYWSAYNYYVRTIVKKWDPVSNNVEILGTIYSVIISRTHMYYNGKILVPAIKNYYAYNRGVEYLYSVLGVVEVDPVSETIRYYHVETIRVRGSHYDTNDVTTSYEAYIIPYGNNKAILVPSGWDKVLILGLKPTPHLIKEINLQKPQIINDELIITIRKNTLTHSPEAHTLLPEWYNTDKHYWAPQKLDYYISGNTLILPYSYFTTLSPTYNIYGKINYKIIYDKPRIEKVQGVIIIDLVKNTYKYHKLRDLRVENYYLRTITGLEIINKTKILAGLISYNTRRGYFKSILVEYTYDKTNDKWIPHIIHETPINTKNARNIPIIPVINGALTGNYLYINNTIVKYHITIESGGPSYSYLFNPVPLLDPVLTDIDNDGELEYVDIIQYQQQCGTSWGYPEIYYLVPAVRNGWIKLLIIEKPVVTIKLWGNPLPGGIINIDLEISTSPHSTTPINITRNDEEIYSIKANGLMRKRFTINISNLGEYSLELKMKTIYFVNHTLGQDNYYFHEEIINTYSFKTVLFKIKIPTRILLLKPRYNILTPNHYIHGLHVEAIIQYYNNTINKWIEITPTNILEALVKTHTGLQQTIQLYYNKYTNTYTSTIYNLKPGAELEITVFFNGTTIYQSAINSTTIKLIKYPVKLYIDTITDPIPALTNTWINLKTYYMYIDDKGSWEKAPLTIGYLKIQISNSYRRITYTTRLRRKILIPEYMIIPPATTVKITYTPLIGTKYYTITSNSTNIYVKPLIINVNYTSIITWGSRSIINIYEAYNDVLRPISSPYKAYIENKTSRKTLYTISNNIVLDTKYLSPGNYTLTIMVDNSYYARAYINPSISVNISIIPIKIKVVVKPLITINNYTSYTYTLIPVNISIVEANHSRINISVKIVIDNYVVNAWIGETITKIFKKPGVHIIRAETHNVEVTSRVITYPQPVRIEYTLENNIITIKTKDLLDRNAPGLITLRIYHRNTLVNEYRWRINNSITHVFSNLPAGIYYLEIRYTGNKSYENTSTYVIVYLENSDIKPLTEPWIIPLFTVTVLIILIIRRQYNAEIDNR